MSVFRSSRPAKPVAFGPPPSRGRQRTRRASGPLHPRDILAAMFTGIISDIGEVAAREGGRFTIRCRYVADSIALGASIACDGACLTATNCSGPRRLHLRRRRLQRNARPHHARQLAARHAHQPGARAESRRRTRRPPRLRPRRRPRPHRRHPPRRRLASASRWRSQPSCPATSRPRAPSRSTASR